MKATQPCDDVPCGGGSTEDDMKAGVRVWNEYEYFSLSKTVTGSPDVMTPTCK